VLDREELEWCHTNGVPLGYDPVQIGWVPLSVEEDILSRAPDAAATPVLPDEGLSLRPWRTDEAGVLRGLLDDPEVWRHLPEDYPDPLTDEVAAELVAISLLEHHHEVRAVEVDGEVVGQVRLLFDGHGADRSGAEISYWLGRAHWGRGIGTKLVRHATETAFARHASLERLTARVHPDNSASAAVLAKAGYAHGPRSDGWVWFQRRRT